MCIKLCNTETIQIICNFLHLTKRQFVLFILRFYIISMCGLAMFYLRPRKCKKLQANLVLICYCAHFQIYQHLKRFKIECLVFIDAHARVYPYKNKHVFIVVKVY